MGECVLEPSDVDTLKDSSKNDRGSLAPKLARGVVTTVLSGLCLVATLNILEATDALPLVLLALAAMAALLPVQLFFLSSHARRLGRGGRFTMVGLHALGFLPFLAFGQAWARMPGFVAGSALLLLPAPASSVFCLSSSAQAPFRWRPRLRPVRRANGGGSWQPDSCPATGVRRGYNAALRLGTLATDAVDGSVNSMTAP
jgi:hypothetical protein